MNNVLVIGGDHHNTLGVIESLGQKGIKSYALLLTNHKKAYVLHSKYVINGWCCHSEKEIIDCLLKNFRNNNEKTVLIATNDIVASIIDNHAEVLGSYFFIPNTKPAGSLLAWMGKEKMSRVAKEVGLNVPRTWIVSDNKIPNDIEFPVITKAISSVAGTKDNIRVCSCFEELQDFFSHQHCEVIQIQKFIEKDFEFQLMGCSLNGGDEVLIPGRTHIDRPNGMDNTFFLRFAKCEEEFKETIAKAVEFVKRTKYTGPFSIEFLRDKNDGKNYFTEMNFRNDGNAICVTKSGTNIPYILYLSFIGGDYKKEIENSSVDTVYLCPDIYYFTCLLAGEFSFKEWFRNMRKTNCFTTYFPNDKKPFLWFILLAIYNRIFK